MAKTDKELFEKLAAQGLLEQGKQIPTDVMYNAPQGRVINKNNNNKELEEYVPKEPTEQTDLLQDAERQFVLPMVMPLCPIFRVPPITDDVYRFSTEDMKNNGLFCILSRSYVKRLSNGYLVWDPFLVVIKRKIVARLRCVYHPNNKQFQLREVHLWQNNTSSYYRVQDSRLDFATLPGIMEKYIEFEGIFKEESEKE